jgi:hypothetical protein
LDGSATIIVDPAPSHATAWQSAGTFFFTTLPSGSGAVAHAPAMQLATTHGPVGARHWLLLAHARAPSRVASPRVPASNTPLASEVGAVEASSPSPAAHAPPSQAPLTYTTPLPPQPVAPTKSRAPAVIGIAIAKPRKSTGSYCTALVPRPMGNGKMRVS